MNKNLFIGKRILNLLRPKIYSLLGIKTKPNMIHFAVTSKCNLYCETCHIGRDYMQNPRLADDDLMPEEIDNFY